MERKDKIKNAVYKDFKKGQCITTRQIIDCVQKYYPEIPEGSILPGDFCDNHSNNDPFSGKNHIFRRSGRGLYELL